MERLTAAQARRLALVAQGFGRPRPTGAVSRRHLRGLLARVGIIQIDSVSTLVRSHYLPGFSRLGDYPRALLDDLTWQRHELFEYWAHEASLVPVALQPLLRWRMERARSGTGVYGGLARIARDRPDYVAAVLAEVADRGPLAAADLSEPGARASAWWGWGDGKRALEWLFWTGQVSVASRRGSFERLYDLPERVLPAEVLALPTPPVEAAQRELLLLSADRLGVGTESDLRDYFRLPVADAKARLAELVDAGLLMPVTVRGWRQTAYLRPATVLPRRVRARALVAPFDPLVWERSRTERLFDFQLRLEFYVPAHKRVHGYYVMPFLLGDRLVGRVDLKADRAAGVLRVPASHLEPHADPIETAVALAAELRLMADWLELDGIEVADRGALAPPLRAAVTAPPAYADP